MRALRNEPYSTLASSLSVAQHGFYQMHGRNPLLAINQLECVFLEVERSFPDGPPEHLPGVSNAHATGRWHPHPSNLRLPGRCHCQKMTTGLLDVNVAVDGCYVLLVCHRHHHHHHHHLTVYHFC